MSHSSRFESKRLDCLRVLQLEDQASDDEIKRSYKKLALRYHPDKNPNDEYATRKFQELSEAYRFLNKGELEEEDELVEEDYDDHDLFTFLLLADLLSGRRRGFPFGGGPFGPSFSTPGGDFQDEELEYCVGCACFHPRDRTPSPDSYNFASHKHRKKIPKRNTQAARKMGKKAARKQAKQAHHFEEDSESSDDSTPHAHQQSRAKEKNNVKKSNDKSEPMNSSSNKSKDSKAKLSEEDKHSQDKSKCKENSSKVKEDKNAQGSKITEDAKQAKRSSEKVESEETSAPIQQQQPKKLSKKQLAAEQRRREKEMEEIAAQLEEQRQKELDREKQRQEKAIAKAKQEELSRPTSVPVVETSKSAKSTKAAKPTKRKAAAVEKTPVVVVPPPEETMSKARRKREARKKRLETAQAAQTASNAANEKKTEAPKPKTARSENKKGSVVGAVKNQKVVLDWGGDDWDSQGSDGWSTNDGSYKSQGGGDSRNNYTAPRFTAPRFERMKAKASVQNGLSSSTGNTNTSNTRQNSANAWEGKKTNNKAQNSTPSTVPERTGGKKGQTSSSYSSELQWADVTAAPPPKSSSSGGGDPAWPATTDEPATFLNDDSSWSKPVGKRNKGSRSQQVTTAWSQPATDPIQTTAPNKWNERKTNATFYQNLTPKSENEEDEMVRAAIEMSRLQAEEDKLKRKIQDAENPSTAKSTSFNQVPSVSEDFPVLSSKPAGSSQLGNVLVTNRTTAPPPSVPVAKDFPTLNNVNKKTDISNNPPTAPLNDMCPLPVTLPVRQVMGGDSLPPGAAPDTNVNSFMNSGGVKAAIGSEKLGVIGEGARRSKVGKPPSNENPTIPVVNSASGWPLQGRTSPLSSSTFSFLDNAPAPAVTPPIGHERLTGKFTAFSDIGKSSSSNFSWSPGRDRKVGSGVNTETKESWGSSLAGNMKGFQQPIGNQLSSKVPPAAPVQSQLKDYCLSDVSSDDDDDYNMDNYGQIIRPVVPNMGEEAYWNEADDKDLEKHSIDKLSLEQGINRMSLKSTSDVWSNASGGSDHIPSPVLSAPMGQTSMQNHSVMNGLEHKTPTSTRFGSLGWPPSGRAIPTSMAAPSTQSYHRNLASDPLLLGAQRSRINKINNVGINGPATSGNLTDVNGPSKFVGGNLSATKAAFNSLPPSSGVSRFNPQSSSALPTQQQQQHANSVQPPYYMPLNPLAMPFGGLNIGNVSSQAGPVASSPQVSYSGAITQSLPNSSAATHGSGVGQSNVGSLHTPATASPFLQGYPPLGVGLPLFSGLPGNTTSLHSNLAGYTHHQAVPSTGFVQQAQTTNLSNQMSAGPPTVGVLNGGPGLTNVIPGFGLPLYLPTPSGVGLPQGSMLASQNGLPNLIGSHQMAPPSSSQPRDGAKSPPGLTAL